MTISIQASPDGTYGSILVGGVEKFRVDNAGNISQVNNLTATGNVQATGSGGIGYGTGSGGTVTQATSKSTAVTLNKMTGQITMNNAALAANTSATFILNNSLISANDNVVVTLQAGDASGGSYIVSPAALIAGQVYITVQNRTAGSRSEALVLNFSVFKGAIA